MIKYFTCKPIYVSLPHFYLRTSSKTANPYNLDVQEETNTSGSKRRKRRLFVPVSSDTNDDMPAKWRHIRESERKIKPNFYAALDKLISSYHCSKIQAVAGIIITARYMFERDWKFASESDSEIDVNTAPEMIRIRQSGRCIGK